MDSIDLPNGPSLQTDEVRTAMKAYRMLGGVDWAGIPIVAEILGITDLEGLIGQLIVIRDWGLDRA